MSRRRPQSCGALGKRVGHAILDVFDENSLRLRCIAVERAVQKLTVLMRRDFAAKHHGDHLIAQIFVEHRRMRVQQRLRAARR